MQGTNLCHLAKRKIIFKCASLEGCASSQGGYIYNLITNIVSRCFLFVKHSDFPQIKDKLTHQPEMLGRRQRHKTMTKRVMKKDPMVFEEF